MYFRCSELVTRCTIRSIVVGFIFFVCLCQLNFLHTSQHIEMNAECVNIWQLGWLVMQIVIIISGNFNSEYGEKEGEREQTQSDVAIENVT